MEHDEYLPVCHALGSWMILLIAMSSGCHLASCRSTPPIKNYQPEVADEQLESSSETPSSVVLAVEDFSANAAYDEQRIVYRTNRVQINYYHYHRWAAPPGLLVSDVLKQVYRQSNRFRAVLGGFDSRADVVLGGRVIRFEEFDTSESDWQAQVVMELRLRDASTGDLLWDKQWTDSLNLEDQSPLGLAQAMGRVLTRIGRNTAPDIIEQARRAQQTKQSTRGGSMSEEGPSE